MPSKKFPCTIVPMDSRSEEKLKPSFLAAKEGWVKVGPKKFVLSQKYAECAGIFYNFEVRSDDVWVITVPRSGTTLTQEMVWLILNNDKYEAATDIALHERFIFLESSTLVPEHVIERTRKVAEDETTLSQYLEMIKPQWEILKSSSGRRFIKTHLPLSLLPPNLLQSGAKVIYVARNPKDVAISRYHQERSLAVYNFVGDFQAYWDLFESDMVHYTPYWKHLEEGWESRHAENFLFLFFEDILKDYKQTIVQLSEFLGRTMTDGQVSKLVDYLKVDTYRQNVKSVEKLLKLISVEGTYQHVRSGKTGNWNEYFTGDLEARARKWIEENYKKTTLRFPIELY